MGAGFMGLTGPCGPGVYLGECPAAASGPEPPAGFAKPPLHGKCQVPRSLYVAAKGLGLTPKSPPAGDHPQVLPGDVGRGPSATGDGSWTSVPKALENPSQFLLRGAVTSLWTPSLPRVWGDRGPGHGLWHCLVSVSPSLPGPS